MSQLKTYRSVTDRIWQSPRKIRRSDRQLVDEIRTRARSLENLAETDLVARATKLRQQLHRGLNVLSYAALTESFALTTEALRRATGKVYYDVQLLGGLVLATGSIAEMQTGEGKTITCGLPAVLYGFSGAGVHVATTNAYLAARDHKELLPIFQMLGLTSGLIENDQDVVSKRHAYRCDITYGTGYEFGFDFLRDQLALRSQPKRQLGTRFLSRMRGLETDQLKLMQRSPAFAIIDEADSVLIDEAAIPLILTGPVSHGLPNRDVYFHAMKVADGLECDVDFETDMIKKTIVLTDDGWKKTHQDLPGRIQSDIQRPWSQYVEQSLRARLMMKRGVDYVVEDNEIVIVDQHTGRTHKERKWRSGLHQSVEMREDVPLTEEREIEARITRQRYFQFYDRISGMTGTAVGNEPEFLEFYRLLVIEIPRNKPSIRRQLQSRYFANNEAKYRAIIRDIAARKSAGQSILVGTRTITQSRQLATLLENEQITHTVLNGTQDTDEAIIIAAAGKSANITIATNMAGRGTDIRLNQQAKNAGGLHVIIVEHQESQRVDRQLMGRCARQSDPGSCQFFVSAEDDIICRYDAALAKSIKRSANHEGECHANFDREIINLQTRIEKLNFAARQKMVTQDRWIEDVQKSVAQLI